jgi:phosphoribosylamine--glycine ligase
MQKHNIVPAVIGKDGRTSAIIRCLRASARVGCEPQILSEWKNETPEKARENVLRRAREIKPHFVIVGPEQPLAEGVVDALQEELGIPCVGPTKALARLESSKAFTRRLVSEYGIPGNPEYRVFQDLSGLDVYLRKLGDYVVKPDGLTGGKGVKLSGAHLHTVQEAVDYCQELLHDHSAVIIEEKLDGEEFSLQSFCDGTEVKDMVVVQDHKRAWEGDSGPNTGGMGSYSCENHSLPFLLPKHLEAASAINKAVAKALVKKTGKQYKGILYGGFMATHRGVILLEYNARFGDPETLNVLSLLKTDFVDICEAIVDGKLKDLPVTFEEKATVCKYVVPDGYPDNPVKGKPVDLSKVPEESDKLKIYHAALDQKGPDFYLSGSRAIAFVGIGSNLSEAEAIAEEAASAVRGPVYHRRDIGTEQLIQDRIQHMRTLTGTGSFLTSITH